jgi:hypothetical protein
MFGQRGAEWRHRLAEPGLGERDHVHIALDHDDAAGLAAGGRGAIEIVERAPLVEERGVGGIEVFGFALANHPSAECDHAPARVADRDHQPPAKPVVRLLVVDLDQHARFDQRGVAIALELFAQLATRIGRIAHAEGARGFRLDPALLQYRPRFGARDAVQLVGEELRGIGHQIVQALGALGAFDRLAILRGHFHPGGLSEFLDRVDERQALLLGHPADRIAVRRATEAVIEALVVVDVKARRLLVMERAAALILSARLGQLDGLADQRGQQGPRAEFVEKGGGETHPRIISRYWPIAVRFGNRNET